MLFCRSRCYVCKSIALTRVRNGTLCHCYSPRDTLRASEAALGSRATCTDVPSYHAPRTPHAAPPLCSATPSCTAHPRVPAPLCYPRRFHGTNVSRTRTKTHTAPPPPHTHTHAHAHAHARTHTHTHTHTYTHTHTHTIHTHTRPTTTTTPRHTPPHPRALHTSSVVSPPRREATAGLLAVSIRSKIERGCTVLLRDCAHAETPFAAHTHRRPPPLCCPHPRLPALTGPRLGLPDSSPDTPPDGGAQRSPDNPPDGEAQRSQIRAAREISPPG